MVKEFDRYVVKLALFCIIMAALLISAGELFIRSDAEHERTFVRNALQSSGTLIAQNIQRNITSGIFTTDTLHTLLKNSDYRVDNFNSWGRAITASTTGASVVQLAPDGIVTYIYPLEGNEGAMGHSLLSDSRRDEGAKKAIESRALTFVGPIKLIQNGKYAVTARKPILRNIEGQEKFWGFAIALILVEDILPEKINIMESQGIGVHLEGDNPDVEENPIFFKSENWEEPYAVKIPIEVPNGKWILKLSHPPIANEYYNVFRIITVLVSVIFFLYIFVQQYNMRTRQQEIVALNNKLTELTFEDELTGVGNRRSGMQFLDNQLYQAERYSGSFSIAMLDFDYFKQVNDLHGHPVGDELLRHLAVCLKKGVRQSDMVFRLGGDEFMMIFPQTDLKKSLKAIQNMLHYMKEHPCHLEETVLPICLSIGLVENHNSETAEDLLQRADVKLYEAKDAGRNCVRY